MENMRRFHVLSLVDFLHGRDASDLIEGVTARVLSRSILPSNPDNSGGFNTAHPTSDLRVRVFRVRLQG